MIFIQFYVGLRVQSQGQIMLDDRNFVIIMRFDEKCSDGIKLVFYMLTFCHILIYILLILNKV